MLLLGIGSAPPAAAQASFPGSGSEPNANLRVYPLDVWGPRVGPGLGAGLVVHHLGRHNAQWLATIAPAWHEQVATLSFASAYPERAQQYVFATVRGLHTDRRWFYGLGPAASDDARLSFRQTSLRARVGVGRQLWSRRLHLRPHLTLHHVRTTGVTGDRSALSSRSQQHVARLRGAGPPGARPTGVRAGITVQYKTEAPARYAPHGVRIQGTWDRYADLNGSELAFDQLDLTLQGIISLVGQHRLDLQTGLVRTWSRGEAPIPFYHLPTLDGSVVPGWARSRFVGRDRLTASAYYRFPLSDASPVFDLDGHLGLHAAGIYDDLPSQFHPALDFDPSFSSTASTYPLRPSASIGLQVRMPMRPRTTVDVALGISPEGLSAARLTVNRPLHFLRPPHHTSRSLR
jgi:hypothetical protein